MKSNKTTNSLLLICGVFLAASGILKILLIWTQFSHDGIGIIGGADAPTTTFLFQKIGWGAVLRIVFGTLCVIVNIIALKRGGDE